MSSLLRRLRRVIRGRTLWLSLGLLVVAVGLYLYRDVQPLRCPIKLHLGIACPGCGSMRVGYALLEGRLLDALRLNALALIAYLLAGVILLVKLWDEWHGTELYRRLFRREIPLRYILALLILVWLYWYFWIVEHC